MKKLLMMIGAAAVAVGANAGTVTTNGVTWTYSEKDDTAKTVTLGRWVSDTDYDTAMPKDASWNACEIPGSFVINGETYTVTKLARFAFQGCTKLTGVLRIPDSVTGVSAESYAHFDGCTGLTGVSSFGGLPGIARNFFLNCSKLKGPLPSFSAFTSQADTGLYSAQAAFRGCSSLSGVCINGDFTLRMYQLFYNDSALRVLLIGPNVSEGTVNYPMRNVTNCKMLAPKSKWNNFSFTGTGNELLLYGPGEDFDLSIDETNRVVTTTPVTEAGLRNVLDLAPLFKTHLGLNTRVNVTNTIEVSSGSITSEKLEAVEFNTLLLTFAVTTQEQLDALLDAFPATTYPMLAIEVKTSGSGKTEKLTLPSDRKLWVALPGDGVYTPKYDGTVITFY